MKSGLLRNEKGFLHPFLLFLTAFFLLLITSGSLLLTIRVQSTELLFEQYKLEQAASIATNTVEKHYLQNLNAEEKTLQIHNDAVEADVTISKNDEQIVVHYVIKTDYTEKPMIFYKKYHSS
ncbi:hypothetical protein SAMN05421663_11312 [Terribacillus halophilus]|uniref:Competence protein ComGG n=1 Tax=Terribacillus halophilus TaxID=361279 RepID=A0A1G6VJV8_9BACI|nr:hypothetical protein [Terribacillus halophilus]SDD53683.1 hypothetical protein SAMN05421663_11312 [Terribacillus halophilus]